MTHEQYEKGCTSICEALAAINPEWIDNADQGRLRELIRDARGMVRQKPKDDQPLGGPLSPVVNDALVRWIELNGTLSVIEGLAPAIGLRSARAMIRNIRLEMQVHAMTMAQLKE